MTLENTSKNSHTNYLLLFLLKVQPMIKAPYFLQTSYTNILLFSQNKKTSFLLYTATFLKRQSRFKLRLRKNRFAIPGKVKFQFAKLLKSSIGWGKIITAHLPHRSKTIKLKRKVLRNLKKEFSKQKKSINSVKHTNVLKAWIPMVKVTPRRQIVATKHRIFLNETLILKSLNQILYRSNSQRRKLKPVNVFKKTTFVNMYKKVSWKMRMSRYAHWNLRVRGTLNEWRYDKLLNWELQTKSVGFSASLYYCARLLLGPVTWKNINKLFKTNLILLNGRSVQPNAGLVSGDILEFPYGPNIPLKKITSSESWNQQMFKARKFTYNAYKNRKSLTKVPHVFKKLSMHNKTLGIKIAVDTTVGVAFIVKTPKNKALVDTKTVLKTTVLTLNNWRFRFD